MPELRAAFAKKLGQLSRTKTSIAQVCRDLGINRQQFNRYLAGETLPNEQNFERISKYFGVEKSQFFDLLAQEDGVIHSSASRYLRGFEAEIVANASKIEHGNYSLYMPIPGKPESILKGLVIIKALGPHTVFSRMIVDKIPGERSRLSAFERHEGFVFEKNGIHTFLATMHGRQADMCLSFAHVIPGSRGRLYSGISLTSRVGNPAARRVVIEKIKQDGQPLLRLARDCGIVSINDPALDQRIIDIIAFGHGDPPYMAPRFAD
jgi:transcriptional regulator with XRE-family HTH domain